MTLEIISIIFFITKLIKYSRVFVYLLFIFFFTALVAVLFIFTINVNPALAQTSCSDQGCDLYDQLDCEGDPACYWNDNVLVCYQEPGPLTDVSPWSVETITSSTANLSAVVCDADGELPMRVKFQFTQGSTSLRETGSGSDGETLSTSISGLTDDTRYKYDAKAQQWDSGASKYWGNGSDLTSNEFHVCLTPSDPSNLNITEQSGNDLKLTWDQDVNSRGKTNIYRDGSTLTTVNCSGSCSYTDTTTSCGTTYTYEVEAVNSCDSGSITTNSTNRASKTVTTSACPQPDLIVTDVDITTNCLGSL